MVSHTLIWARIACLDGWNFDLKTAPTISIVLEITDFWVESREICFGELTFWKVKKINIGLAIEIEIKET